MGCQVKSGSVGDLVSPHLFFSFTAFSISTTYASRRHCANSSVTFSPDLRLLRFSRIISAVGTGHMCHFLSFHRIADEKNVSIVSYCY